jgi:hypothetical protein
MFALLRFFLALFSSLFKSKSRLEAENAAVIPENLIRADSRNEAESAHHSVDACDPLSAYDVCH